MSVLSVRGLTHIYGKGTPFMVNALNDVSFDIEKGELIGLIGHTGSGKSTLIQHFNGLLKPDSGRILLNGEDIWGKKNDIRAVRFKVGLCFQYPEYQLFEDTVYKDIAFGPGNMGLSEDEIRNRVLRTAGYVGLTPQQLDKSPFDLSGGEKRRAAIAGVMAMEPEVLVLDEPTAGLDPRGSRRILELVSDYRKQTGSTVVIVTHNMEDIAVMANRVLVMNKGEVFAYDTVDKIFSRSDELRNIGLNVPQITRIFIGLRKKGLDVRQGIYTVEQGRTEILRLLEGRRSK